MVHMALHTKTPLAHAHCKVEQATRSYRANIGGGGSVSWVKRRVSKSTARGRNVAQKIGPITKKWLKVNSQLYVQKTKAVYTYETRRQIFKHP